MIHFIKFSIRKKHFSAIHNFCFAANYAPGFTKCSLFNYEFVFAWPRFLPSQNKSFVLNFIVFLGFFLFVTVFMIKYPLLKFNILFRICQL